ncbi:P-type ATPase (P-ATPase) Superfamily [Pseudoloma neurophilia]|uniref:P-type ATPase (P-ATPase) Superfamily n=1 Tax=Pseudoloma neurophilia TaxID=146866 RepID=A0A0R0LYE4_9MICR|nr:P-type ATPase (P-ATPase) Superfamily [Pseudoloma neurophilia]
MFIKKLPRHLINFTIAPFCDKFSLILVSLQIFSYFLSKGSILDSCVTICFLYLNAAIEMIQNIKNEKEVDNFNQFFQIKAKVWTKHGLELREKVKIGDIVHLNIGDRIPGDGILLDQAKFNSTDILKVDESLLTGESESIIKKKSTITWNEAFAFQENYFNHIIMKNTIYDKILTNAVITGKNFCKESIVKYAPGTKYLEINSIREVMETNDGLFEGETFYQSENGKPTKVYPLFPQNDMSRSEEELNQQMKNISEKYFEKEHQTQRFTTSDDQNATIVLDAPFERTSKDAENMKDSPEMRSLGRSCEKTIHLQNSFVSSENDTKLGDQNINDCSFADRTDVLAEIVHKVNSEIKTKDYMLTAGSFVTQGTGLILITNKGKYIHEIKTSLEEIESDMTGKVEKIQRILFIGILIACFCLFLFCFMKNQNALEIAVSLAVTAIPEGLELVVRINLSVIIFRLKQQKIFVKSLHALEKVGTINTIVFDKTGTLTTNQQSINCVLVRKTVQKELTATEIKKMKKLKKKQLKEKNKRILNEKFRKIPEEADASMDLENGAFSNFQKIEVDQNELISAICGHLNDVVTVDDKEVGDPIDLTMKREGESKNSELLHFVPFCGEKMLTHGMIELNGEILEVIKGAPEKVLAFCDKFEDGLEISESEKNGIIENLKLRSVALGFKKLQNAAQFSETGQLTKNFTFLALVTFRNNLREGTKECLQICLRNKINICILTGDAEQTTKELLKKISLPANFSSASNFIKNKDEELDHSQIHVIFRASPYQKHQIIKILQKHNKVLMAGDGINDLLAIKQADVGVSLGDGSDLSKETSQIVFTDSNISNILLLIQSGRLSFHNITAVLKYLISSNIGEVIAVTLALLTQNNILNSRQLLFINILTDGFPATFLCMNKKYENGSHIVLRSLLIAFYIGITTFLINDTTKSFIFIMVAEMVNSLTNISLGKSIFRSYDDNLPLMLVVCLILLFLPSITYFKFTRKIFEIGEMSISEYFGILSKAIGVILIDEILKCF